MANDIYSQTPVSHGEGVRPQSDAEIKSELRNAARNGDLVVSKRNGSPGVGEWRHRRCHQRRQLAQPLIWRSVR